jgi:ABC-2 type transport system permease protein
MSALTLAGTEARLLTREWAAMVFAFAFPPLFMLVLAAFVTAVLIVLAAGLVVATAAPIYGIPPIEDVGGVIAGFAAGTVTMIALGVVLGLAVPTARAAQALGLLVFMPMWLLGGGPPPEVMSDAMQNISDLLPLTHATTSIREAWLSGDPIGGNLAALGIWLAIGMVAIALLLRRRDARA